MWIGIGYFEWRLYMEFVVFRINRFTRTSPVYHSPGGHKHWQPAEGSHLVSTYACVLYSEHIVTAGDRYIVDFAFYYYILGLQILTINSTINR